MTETNECKVDTVNKLQEKSKCKTGFIEATGKNNFFVCLSNRSIFKAMTRKKFSSAASKTFCLGNECKVFLMSCRSQYIQLTRKKLFSPVFFCTLSLSCPLSDFSSRELAARY